MKKIYGFLIASLFSIFSIAGNVAGGDIGIDCITGNTRQLTITMWGNHFSTNDTLHIYFGDNTSTTYSDQNAFSLTGLGSNYPNDSAIKWVFTHVYPGPGNYSITASYTNRDTGIANIPNSENTLLTLAANFTIDPNVGCNNSPYLTNNYLIELLAVSTNYMTNFGAVDPEGDSLSYRAEFCLDTSGIISGYTYPDVLGSGNFSVNAITGDISWASPLTTGKYNVVIAIEEWKLFSNNQRSLIETTMREIQFYVESGVGIQEQNSLTFSCFPNPLLQNEQLHFQFEKSGNYFLNLFDAEGKNVFANSVFCEKQETINLPALSPGIYFLTVSDEGHLLSTRKIQILNP